MRIKVMRNEDPEDEKKMLESGKKMNSQMAREDNSLDVWTDMLAIRPSIPRARATTPPATGKKSRLPGGASMTFFVVKEDGVIQAAGHATTNPTPSLWRCWTASRPAI